MPCIYVSVSVYPCILVSVSHKWDTMLNITEDLGDGGGVDLHFDYKYLYVFRFFVSR